MKNIRKFLFIFLIILIILSMTGCWNYKEIDEVLIVTAIAIDKEGDDYIVTTETISAKGGETIQMESDILSAKGETVFDAIRNTIMLSGEKLYFSHAKAVIVSEDIAKEGIAKVIDFLHRDAELRSDLWILVSRDKTAKMILEGEDKVHDSIGFHIDEILRNQKNIPKFYAVELIDLLDALASTKYSATLPTTTLAEKKEEIVPEIYGTAVFRKDKLVGWLDGDETKTMLIVKDKAKDGLIVVSDIEGSDTKVALEVINCKTKIKPILKDENLTMDISTEIKAGIGSIVGYEDYIKEDGRNKLKSQAQEQIKKEVLDTISKVQENYKSDIFGFGREVYMQMPDLWKTLEDDWDNVFSDLQVNVEVDVQISGSSLTNTMIKVGD